MDVAGLRAIFSSRIRKLREGKMNQGEFADSVGVSRGAMSYYEQELRTPDIGVLRSICEKYKVSADYMLGLMPDTNHAVSDVCLETGLYPKAAKRLKILQRLKEMEIESAVPVIEEFIDEDVKEALQMMVHTAATPMINLLLMTDEGLNLLTLLSAIIFGAELVSGSLEEPQPPENPRLKFMTNHKNIQIEYPLPNLAAALWINAQEEAAKLRRKLDGKEEKPE